MGLAGVFAASEGLAGEESVWSRAQNPAEGPALAIGGYSAGCVQGARALAFEQRGFRVMKPERRRNFGHPRLVEFVEQLGTRLTELELEPLGVGDLGQPRGGPAPNGHASHQNGLDVDLWFSPAPAATAEQHPVVDLELQKPNQYWTPRVPKLLELAARDVRVDRIFVNAVIKKELCEHTEGDKSWLSKLRPWWGHYEHFHVRLACPSESPECQAQPPIPAGDGCGELEWWLSPESSKDRSKGGETYSKRVGATPKLPTTCKKVARKEGAQPAKKDEETQ